MKKILFITLLVFSCNTFALSSFWVGIGSTTRNFATAQNDKDGATTKFKFNPTVLVGTVLPFFFPGFYFVPGIGYGKHSAVDDAKRSEIILQYHISQEIWPFFYAHYGFSNTITKVSGKGGTVVLNNGSSTATFYTPDTAQSSYMASLDVGAELLFTNEIATRLQISIDRFLSSERRRVSHLFTINYYF